MSDLFVGVDLGGTNIKAGLLDGSGNILKKLSIPTEGDKDKKKVFENICKAARSAAEKAAIDKVKAVGIGSPGPLDYRTGIVHTAPNLPGWENVPLADEIASRLGMKIFVENDANAACWAEYWAGAGKGHSSVVLLTLGTGIGGGIIIENRLWRGSTSGGAEIGHMVIDCDGERCACGNVGCLETYASAPATVRRFLRMVEDGAESSLSRDAAEGKKITASKIHEAAGTGDETARKALEETGRYLGIGIANIANVINPEIVLFSGGLSGAADILIPAVEQEVHSRAFDIVTDNLIITTAGLPDDAGIIGAAGCAKERLLENG